MPPVIAPRIRSVQKMLRTKVIDGFLVTSMKNVRYLSGFAGSSGFLLVTKSGALFVTDFRYQEQAERQVVCSRNYYRTRQAVEPDPGTSQEIWDCAARVRDFGEFCPVSAAE